MTDDERKQQVSEQNRRYYLAHKAEAHARYMAHQEERIAYQHHRRSDPEFLEHEKARNGTWRQANMEKVRATQQQYRKTHAEALALKAKAYYEKHAEEISAKARAWHAAHPEQKKATATAWYQQNTARIRANVKRWREEHPEEHKALKRRREALKKGAGTATLSAADWEFIQLHYHFRCIYCGIKPEKLTQDHITPLSRGGSHTLSNVVPACKSCNSKKHIGPPLKPIQPLLL